MKKNVGGIDRILRVVVGVAAMGAGYYYQNWLGAIGIVPVLTALIGWCPAYPLLGLSSKK